MKKTIFPVGNIKSDILRRAAMFIAFPLLVLWYFNWRLVAFPLAVLWNAIEAALRAAVESIRLDFSTAPMRLLAAAWKRLWSGSIRSEEHTSELQSLMRISYAVFCLKKKHTKTLIQHMYYIPQYQMNLM